MAAMAKTAEKMLMHRTLDNLHHFSTGEAVRPPMSTSPEQTQLRSLKGTAFSAEELNNIYHLVKLYKMIHCCFQDHFSTITL